MLRKTILPGETPPFVMELPSYKIPEFRVVLHRMLESGWEFLYRAGTLILAVMVIVWAAAYYPHDTERVESPFRQPRAALQERLERFHQGDSAVAAAEIAAIQAELRRIDNQIAGAHMRHSYLGRLGRWIEPLVKPLGWDWKIGCAVIASFPARSGRGNARRHLQPGRRQPGQSVVAGRSAAGHLGWLATAGLQHPGRPVDHGVLRPLRNASRRWW